jgi:hypothetical protein
MSDAQLQRFMKKQYMINRQILKCLREIDEELDFNSDQFGCSDLDELKQLITEQGDIYEY